MTGYLLIESRTHSNRTTLGDTTAGTRAGEAGNQVTLFLIQMRCSRRGRQRRPAASGADRLRHQGTRRYFALKNGASPSSSTVSRSRQSRCGRHLELGTDSLALGD